MRHSSQYWQPLQEVVLVVEEGDQDLVLQQVGPAVIVDFPREHVMAADLGQRLVLDRTGCREPGEPCQDEYRNHKFLQGLTPFGGR